MKALFFAGCFFLLAAIPSAAAGERPPLTAGVCYDEDYSFLSDPSKRTDVFDPIKYIPFGPGQYISFGGEIRERYEDFIKNPLFGLKGLDRDDYLLNRILLHADAHLSPNLRAFFQLGYHSVYGKQGAVTSTEQNRLDLQQGFAEARFPLNGSFDLRAGRQEIVLGSQRLVGYREGPNIRLSFDAVRGTYTHDKWNVTAFAGRPVLLKSGGFDDEPDPGQSFSGIYAVMPVSGDMNADLYFLDLDRADARFAQGTADERRLSAGARLWNKGKSPDYNFEFVYQWGRFGAGDIRAWTAASDTGYTWRDAPWSPRLGLKAGVASGDKNPADSDLSTFNALFPKGAYFTENALVGPANFMDLQPNVAAKPLKDVSVNLGADILWRQDIHDGVYRQPNIPIPGTAGNPHRYTGTQGFILGTWQVDPHLSLTATFVHFAVGEAIRQAGGGNGDYLGSSVSYRF